MKTRGDLGQGPVEVDRRPPSPAPRAVGEDLPGPRRLLHPHRLDPESRGHVYAAAAIALGARAPASYRRAATLLLFATERPYFGPAG